MSIVDKFGEKVGEIAENDPVKARKLLLAGYRLQEKRLALFPDRKLPCLDRIVFCYLAYFFSKFIYYTHVIFQLFSIFKYIYIRFTILL
jgi:hypothetical protein